MVSSFFQFLGNFASRFPINPILVREMRQAVRNRLVLVMLNLYLAALIFLIVFLMISNAFIQDDYFGAILFWWQFGIMNVATTVTVLLFTMARISIDRINEDAMFISTLSPGKIIRGKIYAGMVISLLFYSITLPFMTLAYLMRGFDIWVMLLAVPGSFVFLQVINIICLAFFSGVKSYLQWALFIIPFLATGIAVGVASGAMIGMCIEALSFGFITYNVVIYTICAALFGLAFLVPSIAYFLAIVQLSPSSTNRMFRLRVWLTFIGFFMVFACILEHAFHDYPFALNFDALPGIVVFVLIWTILFTILSLIFICEREKYGIRERQSIPWFLPLRIFVFPFFTGSANAVFWLGCAILLVSGFTWVMSYLFLPASWMQGSGWAVDHEDFVWMMTNINTFSMFIFDYCVTALFLRNLLLARLVPKHLTWLVALGLMFLGVLGSYVFMFIFDIASFDRYRYFDRNDPTFQMQLYHSFNPFTFIDEGGYRTCQKLFAFVWMLALGVVSLGWVALRFTQFTRHAEYRLRVAQQQKTETEPLTTKEQ